MIGVDVHGVSAHVFVIGVAAVFVIVSVLCIRLVVVAAVVVAMVVVVVVAVAVVVATVVVAAVPCGVAVVCAAVIHDRRAMPAAIPTAVAPAAASTAHHGPYGDSNAESNDGGGGDVARGIIRSHIGRAVNNRRVVHGNVHNLWIGRLNHDDLRRLLHDSHLGRGLEIAGGLGFRAQGLDGCHDLSLLIVKGLSQRGSPGEIVRQIGENRGKLRERLDARIPRLLVHGLHQGASRQTRVLRHPVLRDRNLVRKRRRREDLGHERIRI